MKRGFVAASIFAMLLTFSTAVPSAEGAVVAAVRAFTCLSGSGDGCLGKFPDAELLNGDIAIGTVSNVFYVYQFNASATDPESVPSRIRPADYNVGVWYLVSMVTDSVTTSPTTSPTATFLDSDAPGTDKEIAKIVGAYIDGADGAENGTLSLYAHVAGTTTELLKVDGKNTNVVITKPLHVTGEVTGDVKVLSISASCTIGSDCDGTSVRIARGGVILATAALTVTLPEIVATPTATQVGIGASLCVIARDASEALVVDPNANDSISLCNTGACTKDTAGDSITATQAGAKICLVAVELDNWMDMGTRGTWTAN